MYKYYIDEKNTCKKNEINIVQLIFIRNWVLIGNTHDPKNGTITGIFGGANRNVKRIR